MIIIQYLKANQRLKWRSINQVFDPFVARQKVVNLLPIAGRCASVQKMKLHPLFDIRVERAGDRTGMRYAAKDFVAVGVLAGT